MSFYACDVQLSYGSPVNIKDIWHKKHKWHLVIVHMVMVRMHPHEETNHSEVIDNLPLIYDNLLSQFTVSSLYSYD